MSGETTGARRMRNRCAFTSRDMSEGWADAFTYAVVFGWAGEPGDGDEDCWDDLAAQQGWDPALVEFLRDAHRRFTELAGDAP